MNCFLQSLRQITRTHDVQICCAASLLTCLLLFFPLRNSAAVSPACKTPGDEAVVTEQQNDAPESSPELSLFEDIPIVVSASKKPERVTTAPSIISIIRAEEIERMGARTLMDVLRTIPGVEITRDRFGLSQIVVRGLREEHSRGVKILVDNHALNDPITGGAITMYDDLSLNNVSRIEIIRGPASTLYGANAFVSVIHVITRTADEIDGLTLSLGGGSFDSYNPSLLFGKVFDDLAMTFSAEYVTTRGPALHYGEDGLSHSGWESASESFSSVPRTMREEREKLALSWKLDYRNCVFQGNVLDKHRGPFLSNFYTVNDDSFEDSRHVSADLKYGRYATERIKFEGRVYADAVSLKNTQQVRHGLQVPISHEEFLDFPEGVHISFRGKNQRYGFEGQLNLQISQHHDLTLGSAYEYSESDDVFFRTNTLILRNGSSEAVGIQSKLDGAQPSTFQHVVAFFAQDQWQIRPALGLTLGLRGDYYSEFGGVMAPKAGLSYGLNDNWTVKALFGSGFRVPSFMETFFVGIPLSEGLDEQDTVVGDSEDELMLEELRTFELGASYQGSKWLRANVNYFYSDFNHLVEVADDEDTRWVSPGASRLYKNVGGIDVHGFEAEMTGSRELEIDLGLIPRIIGTRFRINYSYQDARDAESGERVPDVARHKGNIGVNFRLSAAENGPKNRMAIFRTFSDEFSCSLNLFLCGQRERSADDVRKASAGYGLLDLNVEAYDIFHTQLDLALSVKNLLDAEYADPSPLLYHNKQETVTGVFGDFPAPGRSFFVEFHYRF